MSRTVPIRTLSRYELHEEIGRGNMGVVYKSHDPAMGRTVAVKIVRFGFSLDDEQRAIFVERFHREAQIAGKLNHPGIVAVHDFGSGDEPFLVMEYFPGVSLQALLKRGPLPVSEAELIVRQLASALAYAHSQGVVHRDIKPGNVLYRDGQIKLVDFGIARLEASELTATGEFIGTPSYMPPEVFSGAPVDGRSDLFSLGVVLYELLTGRKPFDGQTVSRTIYRVLHEDPVPPSHLREGLSAAWDIVCRNLLEKDRNKRYEGAEGLLSDLDRMARGERIAATSGDEPTEPVAYPWPSIRLGRLLVFPAIALAFAIGILFRTGPGIESVSPANTEFEPTLAGQEEPAPVPPLVFVARHEHTIGHCTGDLSLGEDGIVFETSRHRGWRWRPDEVKSIVRRGGDELELLASSRERGKRGEIETYRFTFLRPELSRSDFERYADRRRESSGE